MITTSFVIREKNRWAADYNLMAAIRRFKRLTGKYPTNNASIVMFEGEDQYIDDISIDDLGDITYNKYLIKTNIQ